MLLNFHSVDTNYTHTQNIQLKAKSIWIKSNKLISKLLSKQMKEQLCLKEE